MLRKTSRGAVALTRVMRRQKLTQGDVRRAVGASSGMVTRWLRDPKRKPGREYASKLAKLYGIKIEWWDEDALVEDDEPARALTGS